MCNCGCRNQTQEESPPPAADPKGYVCYQCNTFKEIPPGAPVPECCGKKMQEMD